MANPFPFRFLQAVEGVQDSSELSDPEAASEPPDTVRMQSAPSEMVTKTPFVRELSKSPPQDQQMCVVS